MNLRKALLSTRRPASLLSVLAASCVPTRSVFAFSVSHKFNHAIRSIRISSAAPAPAPSLASLSFQKTFSFSQQQHQYRPLTMSASTSSDENNTTSPYVTTRDPIPSEHLPSWMKAERTRMLTSENIDLKTNNDDKENCQSIVYWMQRDVRTVDNWALSIAAHLAEKKKVPLHVIHVLHPPPSSSSDDTIPDLESMGYTERHGSFLLGGLQCVHDELKEKDVPLHILRPHTKDSVDKVMEKEIFSELSPMAIICDFHPIRHFRRWIEVDVRKACEKAEIPLWQVDAHNVVPVWHAADKRQVGARTLRPRINKVVQDYMQKFPKFKGNEHCTKTTTPSIPNFEYKTYEKFLDWDTSVPAVSSIKPGTDAAKAQFEKFVSNGLAKFDELRNDPNYSNICSNLSPWINHGHISFQRCLTAVRKLNKHANGTASFVEEGLIRRELSDNFLYYTPDDYDKLTAAAGWAQETLDVHSSDKREYLYSLEELEGGKTHDDLWNAAQLQVVREGGMHGFLRMYWAKKILEWTESPEIALHTAQYFNDKYALDGRDANGFVGVGWSMMGIHDQGWKEREVFGKIRYMNYNGCKRKFKVADFVSKYKDAAENAAKAGDKRSSSSSSKSSQTKKRKSPSS